LIIDEILSLLKKGVPMCPDDKRHVARIKSLFAFSTSQALAFFQTNSSPKA
jgi:hypothetical protein